MVKINPERFLGYWQRSGLTVWGFCEKLHISFRTWTKILTGQKIWRGTANTIARALGVKRSALWETEI